MGPTCQICGSPIDGNIYPTPDVCDECWNEWRDELEFYEEAYYDDEYEMAEAAYQAWMTGEY